ncbi:unnamed protein product, partial [Cyprideis torosa]
MDHLAPLPLWSRCDLPLPKIAAHKGPRLPISEEFCLRPVLQQSPSSGLALGCGSLCLCSSVPQLSVRMLSLAFNAFMNTDTQLIREVRSPLRSDSATASHRQ